MVDNDFILSISDVYSGYGEILILKGVTCHLQRGHILSIIGANGAGKSTLLKTVFGILPAIKGDIYFNEINLVGMKPEKILKLGISYVPQGRCNFPKMTIRENLEMGAYIRTDQRVKHDIADLYEKFPILKERKNELAGNLSGGQQQILEMAMALMLHPKLLLIDEPSLGLSPIMTKQVLKTIQQINKDGTSVLMVEQNAKQALNISDYAFVLELGKNWLDGPAKEIYQDKRVKTHYLGL